LNGFVRELDSSGKLVFLLHFFTSVSSKILK